MKNPRKVLVLFAYLAILLCAIFVARFFYLQVIRSDHFQEKVTEQRVKEIIQLPERGKIVDRNGNVMALSLMAQDVNVYPNLIETEKHQKAVAELLSKTLNLSYDKVLKVVQGNEYWASVAKRVDPEKVAKIKEAGLGGIEVTQSPKRYYPNKNVGSSILGFVNQENVPGAGVELSLNNYLSGIPGYTVAETDNVGKTIPIGYENISTPVDGQQVTLTIDNYMQYVLEKRLAQGQKEMNPVGIHAILMKPQTGEILAMASTPTFDPNNYAKSKPETWTNSPVSYVYEPGSTFKPVYMAQALEMGSITPKSTFYDGAGSINVNGSRIKNFDSRPLGEMTLEDIITNSSNVGMIHISKTMKSKEIVEALKKRGFGQKTGIEMPGEEIGLFPSAEQLNNDPIMKATNSFGQGLSITPVQLITAFSEVINGGYELTPTILSKVEDENNNVLYERQDEEKERTYKKEVSDAMKSYLHANSIVGSGKNYQVDGYESGTKTGSAWVVENGRYKDGVIVGSFLGFAPFENPEYALLVIVNQPEGIEFGGPSAGPIWHDVMEEILRYKSIPKENVGKGEEGEEVKKEITLEMPNTDWMLYEDAKAMYESEIDGVKIKKEGTGNIVYDREYKYKNNQLQITLKVKPIQDKDFVYMPNLEGKTKAAIETIFKETKMKLKFHGEGMVVEQNLTPGRHNKTDELVFWMKKGSQ